MSRENVEQLHRAVAAWNDHDLEPWFEIADPDVDFRPFSVELEGGGAYHGHDGLRHFWRDYFAVFPNFRIEIVEIRDLGEITLAHYEAYARGAESDAPIAQTIWQVAEWRDGRCILWHSYRTEEEALRAVRGES